MKLNAPLIWVLAVVLVSAGVFVHLVRSEGPGSDTVIKAAWFGESSDLNAALSENLFSVLKNNKAFWVGLEPEKNEQFEILSGFIKALRLEHPNLKLIVDEEMDLPAGLLTELGNPETVSVKNNIPLIGEKFSELEKAGQPYALVTASIYSNSFIKKNPLGTMREKYGIRPMTLSLAYLPVDPQDERNLLFGCDTEDHSGTSDWGCIVVNTARTVRRRTDKTGEKKWFALLNLSGEKDYILLVKKK